MTQLLKSQPSKKTGPELSLIAPGLKLRIADQTDLPSISSLLKDFFPYYREDGMRMMGPQEIIDSGHLVMVDDVGFPVGAFWLSDIEPNLHATVNMLIRPRWLKRAFKEKIFHQFLDKAFFVLGIKKIKARAKKQQTGAIKLLKRLRFFNLAKLWNEAAVDGKPVDVYWFELSRHYWEKNRKSIK